MLYSSFNLDHIYNLNISPDIRNYWQVFISTVLWVVWLVRNECLYLVMSKKKERTLPRINLNSKRISGMWDMDPIIFLKLQMLQKKDVFLNMLHSNFDFVGFTDGSWMSIAEGNIQAGIGSILLHQKNEIIFFFSSPIIALSPLNAEKEACMFLINSISSGAN